MKPHVCFDPEELSSRSDKFIPVGYEFFSVGWVSACHGQAFKCGDVSDFQSMVMCREPPWVMEEVFVENSRGLL